LTIPPDNRSAAVLPIPAILVAVFVFDADLHSVSRPVFVVITPAVALSVGVVIIGVHSPIATDRMMILLRIVAPHPLVHSPHVVLAHVLHMLVVAVMGSPIATYPSIIGALLIRRSRLLRLLRRALRLHRSSLGLAGCRRLCLVLLGQGGNEARG
jgi:hypothetical protein